MTSARATGRRAPERGGSLDYRRPGVWDRLAATLERAAEPRPSPNCGRVDCAPGWRWRPRLTDYDLWLPVKGRGAFRLGERAYPVRAGTLLLLRPGDSGWATQDPADRLTVLYVHLDFFVPGQDRRAALDGAWLPSRAVPFADAARLDPLLTQIVRLMDTRQRLAATEAKLLLGQALLEVYRQDALNQGFATARLDPRVARVTARLRGHPEERPTLAEAAAASGLSPAYFSRLFKGETGASFREYVVRTRLERARHFLEETELSVGEIARALGYDDLFLFSRQFKAHYGYSPRQVRKGRPPVYD